MKVSGIIVGMAFIVSACQSGQMRLVGEIGSLQEDKIYVGEIISDYYNTFRIIDSAEIVNGKFSIILDNVVPQVLMLGFRQGEGGLIVAENGTLHVKLIKEETGNIQCNVDNGNLNKAYKEYLQEVYVAKQKRILDSLDNLFYAARNEDNRAEMARIKKESIPYYEQGEIAARKVSEKWVENNKTNVLGSYIYYTKLFVKKDFATKDDVDKELAYLHSFKGQALETPYFKKMEQRLDLYANCCIGVVAPEIIGTDTLGNPLKLSDFRGKYVIVDFWNSYCHWCREETPWLQKALETFKNKNFAILGVSNDPKRELWLKAIEEDNSRWDHILLYPESSIMDTYCIKGIPYIILVDPEGRILAKEIRHNDLVDIPQKFMGI